MRGALLLLLLAASAGPRPPSAAAEDGPLESAPGWHWHVEVAPGWERARVDLTFTGVRPKVLRLAAPLAEAFVRPDATRTSAGVRWASRGQGQGWSLEGMTVGAAPLRASYEVDFAGLAAQPGSHVRRVGGDLLTQPTEWLVAPARWLPEHRATLRFHLPKGGSVSAPWAPDGRGGWRLSADALLGESRVAFTAAAGETLPRAGAVFEVHVLEGPRRATPAGIRRWLEVAIDAVAALWERRFPSARVQVLVEPVRPGGEPVVFGQSTQAGGSAVHLLLSAAADDDDLPGEWIAVHELLHLGQPWVVREDAWFMEGFVTYYQELVRGRAGIFDERRTWQALHAGFGRGRRRPSERSVAEDSAAMHASHAYHRVYWAGAALALRVDLALRAETGGRRSLDDAMRLWSQPRFRERKGWRGLELLRQADEAFGTKACVASVEGRLRSSAFPATEDLYDALGLVSAGAEVRLVSEETQAPGAREAVALRGSLLAGSPR